MGLGYRQFTRERLTSADLQGFLMDQSVLNFASASARAEAVPQPVEGMVSYLRDAQLFEDYVNDGWRRRTGTDASSISAGDWGMGSRDLAARTCNPGRPYRVTVRTAILATVGGSAAGTLRLGQDGVVKASDTYEPQGAQALRGAFVERSFTVPDGAALTFTANLDVSAGVIATYTDDRHSFLQLEWQAL